MSARSSRSFVRRTAPRSITTAQVAKIRALVAERDVETHAYPATVEMLVAVRDGVDRVGRPVDLDEFSLAAGSDLIDALLSCEVAP